MNDENGYLEALASERERSLFLGFRRDRSSARDTPRRFETQARASSSRIEEICALGWPRQILYSDFRIIIETSHDGLAATMPTDGLEIGTTLDQSLSRHLRRVIRPISRISHLACIATPFWHLAILCRGSVPDLAQSPNRVVE